MNREILFRGKRICDDKWIYGNLVIDEYGEKHIVESNVIIQDGHHLRIDSDLPVFFKQETIGQYTGLTDKNGTRIFEGDILRTHSGLMGRITFGAFNDDELEAYSYGWYWRGKDREGNSYFLGLNPEWNGHEVIGNIHDRKDDQCNEL